MVLELVNAHTKSVDEVLDHFEVTADKGLSDKQVLDNREAFGKNEYPAEEQTPFWLLVLKQFDDTFVQILLLAAAISFVLAFFEEGEDKSTAFVEPFVILVILIANAAVGVMQENNAEQAIEALKQYEAHEAVVRRNGKTVVVPTADLVPGDIVEVDVGKMVAADMRLIQMISSSIKADQALLTGETNAVRKVLEPVDDEGATVPDKINMLFAGTNIEVGKALGCVVQTGTNTAMGDIRRDLMETDDELTPLKKKIDDFGELLGKVIAVICLVVWVVNVPHFADREGGFVAGAIYYFKIAVALAVAAIPEGLPAVVTTCLALGTARMAKKKAFVRSLPSVETLGCTTVICSDKTGTLTTNQMCANKIVVVNQQHRATVYDVEGNSFNPSDGEISYEGEVLEVPAEDKLLADLAKICTLCNEASVHKNAKSGAFEKVGDATESALKVLAEKIGVPPISSSSSVPSNYLTDDNSLLPVSDHFKAVWQRETILEFNRKRKSMSVLVQPVSSVKTRGRGSAKNKQLLVKGAPEAIVERCSHVRLQGASKPVEMTANIRQEILESFATYSGGEHTLRCLAMAYTDSPPSNEEMDYGEPDNFADIESNLTFVGFVGMRDPPRLEVAGSIAECRAAGIRVIVITGDNKGTAESICRKIGVFGADEDLEGKSMTGREFNDLSAEEQQEAVKRCNLFSRTEPAHKKRLVELLQEQGHVVAMTGDGVNDAPALKKADIGVAMGSGTDVAKGAAAMVLANDNFATIVTAVEEGRAIYNNTKQFIRYLISSNIGEVVSIFLTAITGMPEALVPVQLLWVNLVTDGLPATALGFNPPDSDIMEQPPRSSDEPIVNGWMFVRYLVIGVYVGAATVGGFAWYYMYMASGPQLTYTQLVNHLKCSDADLFAGVYRAALPFYSTHFPEEGAFAACQLFSWKTVSAGAGIIIPSTISLSILVTIEMLNAFNATSENQSILSMPPWMNPYLIWAIMLSMAQHVAILYVPFLANLFGVFPLTAEHWEIVMAFSLPVIVLDEVLKFISRAMDSNDKKPASVGKKNKDE